MPVLGLIAVFVGTVLAGAFLVPDHQSLARGPLSIGTTDHGFGLAIDQDHRIILGELSDGSLRFVRFDSTGRLDPSYGSGGIISLEGEWLRSAISIALQPDGQLVILRGEIGAYELARYQPNGMLDASFGTAGRTPLMFMDGPIPPSPESVASQVALTTDGDIIVVGTTGRRANDAPKWEMTPSYPEQVKFAIARFHRNGTSDLAFGSEGHIIVNVGAGQDTAYGVAIQPDNRIVVVGQTGYMTPGPDDNDIAVLRLGADGATDRSFGKRGVVSTHVHGTLNSSAGSAAIGSDGSVVVVGRGPSPNAVLRYRQDGSLDTSLGEDGTVVIDSSGLLRAAAVQEDRMIVLVDSNGQLTRLLEDGSIDTAFGSNGSVTPPELVSKGPTLARPTGVGRARTHPGFKQIPIEGAKDWRLAYRDSA